MPVRIDLPLPFDLKSVNAWVFPGSQPALVDCGLGTRRSYELLLAGVRGAGVDPARLRLFLTHGHVDHAGNARRLRDDHGVALHAAKDDAGLVSTFRRDSARRNDDYMEAMRDHGMPDGEATALREGSDEIDGFLEDVPIDNDLLGGTRIVLGDDEAVAIRTPGHTDGSTSFLLTEDNDLLTGDTLLEHITSNAGELLEADHGSFHQYVATIESLRRYVGCQALPGHLAPFAIIDAVIDRHLAFHEQRRQRILALLDRPRSAYSLFADIFPGKDQPGQRFMGMAELVGHLHAAEKDGLVRRTDDGRVRRFQRR